MRRYILCFYLILPYIIQGQQSNLPRHPDESLRQGIELFENEKYGAAQDLFSKQLQTSEDKLAETQKTASFYHALCAAELMHKDAEYLLTKFVYDYPESPLARHAWFEIGKFFFRNKKFKDAKKWLEMTNPGELKESQADEYHFKLGYCCFKTEDFDKALAEFAEIKNSESDYYSTAKYYYGHIQYSKKNYEVALENFKMLESDETFSRVVPFYISQIYFLQKKYDKVISYASPVADTIKSRRGPEIIKLIGESYYNTSKYKEALPYLEQYRDKAVSTRIREDDYQLGFTYFKLNKYPEAILCFEKAVGNQDAIGQSAWYHMGWCQLQTGNKNLARNSYREASKSSFDSLLKEQAVFDCAKLAYELGSDPYDEAVRALQDYINTYPSSPRLDESYTFLANIYMTTQNYRVALQSIDRIKKKTESLKIAYQRVAYFRGIELLNDQKNEEAIAHFDLSLKYPNDKTLAGQAHYWKAEALYRSGNYAASIKEFLDFIYSLSAFNQKNYNKVNYNLGYAYFKQKDYSNAIVWFRKFISNSSNEKPRMVQDAYARIGDCYFVNRSTALASDYYQNASEIKGPETDYALYQHGIILGLNGKEQSKISALKKLTDNYPSSPYAESAMFEIGKGYMNMGRLDEAFSGFENLVNTRPKSNLVPEAILQMALIRFNQNQDDEAIELYKKIEQNYAGTESANEAKNGIKRIYLEQGNQEALKPYLKDKSESAKDSTLWEAAENVYLKGKCENSVNRLEQYLKDFPEGIFSLQALAYKARCELSLKKTDDAAGSYSAIIERTKNKYTAEALQMLGIYEREKKNYPAALNHFVALETMAENSEQMLLSIINIMRIHQIIGNSKDAAMYAEKVLKNSKTGDELKNEANLIIARQCISEKKYVEAMEKFRSLKKVNSEIGAEALYSIAAIYFEEGEYDRCEKAIFELIDGMPSYDYWLTKGFILLADNYMKLGNSFQAKRTLQSIIDNHQEDELKELARQKLDAIIRMEDSKNISPEEEKESGKPNEEENQDEK